jgi:beta-phosphoglucomutase-like phosphatase (HAD superfamily)
VAALEDSVVGVRSAAAAGVGVVLGVLNGEAR